MPKNDRISTSMKRATVIFTDPGVGRSIYQENEGCVDHKLRAAIKKASKVFSREYNRKDLR